MAGNSSGFTSGNPNAPQGSQVAFVQKTGRISQAVNFAAAGSYVISFSAAQRANFGTSKETVQVLVDGTVVDTFTPAGTGYATYTTAAFHVAAGGHTISFVGVDPSGADYTAFLDGVSIDSLSPPAPSDPEFRQPVLRLQPDGDRGRRCVVRRERARQLRLCPLLRPGRDDRDHRRRHLPPRARRGQDVVSAAGQTIPCRRATTRR